MRYDAFHVLLGLSFVLGLGVAGVRCSAGESATASSNNGILQLSSRAINLLFERDVTDTSSIHETILGASTRGLAHTRGRITTRLVPDSRQGSFEVRLVGTATMENSVAERRGVTICSSSSTEIDACKRVLMRGTGLHSLLAEAQCVSSIRVNDIEARLRLVERIAWRQASRLHFEMEQAAARHAEARAARHLDVECDTLFNDANRVFRDEVREPLVRQGLWPSRLNLFTTAQHVQLSMLGATQFQQGAPACHPSLELDHDIGVCIHESLIGNIGENTLRNTTVTDRQWLELMRIMIGQAPRPLWVHDRSERWAVTFATDRPLAVVFSDGGFTATLRLDQVTQGEQQHRHPLAILTTHKLEITPEGPKLIRQGNLRIEFSDPVESSGEQAELKAFIERKFGAIFQPVIYFDGLVPPVGATWDKLRQFQLTELASAQGWLVLGYQLAP